MAVIDKGDMMSAHVALNIVPDLSGNARRVAGALLEHFNQKTGRCDPSVERLARMLGVHRATIFRALDELCKGADAYFEMVSGGGRANCNFYCPRWDRFRAIVADWNARMKTGEAPGGSADLQALPCAGSRRAPSRGDARETVAELRQNGRKTATETVAKVRHKPSEGTLRKNPPKEKESGNPSTPSGWNGRNGSRKGREPNRQGFLIHALPGGKSLSHSEAARNAAERRLTRDLYAARDHETVMLALMEAPAIYDQAVAAELERRGSGLPHALAALNGERARKWA